MIPTSIFIESLACRVITLLVCREQTDAHFRRLLRFITKKTVLYTEMVVDDIINHVDNLDFFLGRNIDETPSVIQLGGNNPETLGQAAYNCEKYGGGYGEINLNCGCPSNRVSKNCFGAKLMLDPELVRRIVYEMNRQVSTMTVTVKCRIGVDKVDSYDELKNFISIVHSGGVNKFIIHSRKCLLKGLTPKQNRDVPPLKYDVVHRLCREFPDLKFVLNGGITTLRDASNHMNDEGYVHLDPLKPEGREVFPPVHGVMIGRAVWNNPMMLATADSVIYNACDPCHTRREVLEKYIEYCEHIQSDEGPSRLVTTKTAGGKSTETKQRITTSVLLNGMRNIICGMKGTTKYRQALNDLYVERVQRLGHLYPSPREIVRMHSI